MTQDEIIDMAIKAELNLYVHDLTEKQYIQVIEAFAKLVDAKATAKERETITDEYWSCIQSDLEHGVKSLNEKAALDFKKSMPELSKFGAWLETRGEA